MPQNGSISEFPPGPLSLADARELWKSTTGMSHMERRANKARIEMYENWIKAKNAYVPVASRSDKLFALLLVETSDEAIVGFLAMEKFSKPAGIDEGKRQNRIKNALTYLAHSKQRGQGIGIGLALGKLCYEDGYIKPKRADQLPNDRPWQEKIRDRLLDYWLTAALKIEHTRTPVLSGNNILLQKLSGQVRLALSLNETQQAILTQLLDSLPAKFHLKVLQVLSPHLFRKPQDGPRISPIRLALVVSLCHGAKTENDLNQGLTLALKVPDKIASRLLLGLSINQADELTRRELTEETWNLKIGKEIGKRSRPLSISYIGKLSDRHYVFRLLEQATLIEAASQKPASSSTSLANKVSVMIDSLVEGKRVEGSEMSDEALEILLKTLRPLKKLSETSVEDGQAIINDVARDVAAATPQPSGLARMPQTGGWHWDTKR